jgi:ureidoacrylate peracid hydrolase
MDGPALHDAALTCIRTAFGFVLTADELLSLPQFGGPSH